MALAQHGSTENLKRPITNPKDVQSEVNGTQCQLGLMRICRASWFCIPLKVMQTDILEIRFSDVVECIWERRAAQILS
jgi:hypothetical protein